MEQLKYPNKIRVVPLGEAPDYCPKLYHSSRGYGPNGPDHCPRNGIRCLDLPKGFKNMWHASTCGVRKNTRYVHLTSTPCSTAKSCACYVPNGPNEFIKQGIHKPKSKTDPARRNLHRETIKKYGNKK